MEADAASATEAIGGPEGTTREQYLQWLAELPAKQSPVWLGLPFHAERVLLSTRAKQLTVNVLKLQVGFQTTVTVRPLISDSLCPNRRKRKRATWAALIEHSRHWRSRLGCAR